MDLFVLLWLLAQPLIVICYLCIATVHQKLWLAGVDMNGYGLLRLVLLFLEWFVDHAMWTLLIPFVYLAKLMRLVTSPHASVALVGAHVLLGSGSVERIMRKRKDADAYYMDSGASVSIVNDKTVLSDCKPTKINVATGNKDAPIVGSLVGKLELRPTNKPDVLTFDETIYSPQLPVNLLSVAALDKKKLTVVFEGGMCIVLNKHEVVATGEFDASGLYRMHVTPVTKNPFQQGKTSPLPMYNPGLANVGKYVPSGELPSPMFSRSMAGFMADTHHHNTMDLWHLRLAHASESRIRQMAQQGFIPPHAINLTDKLSFCNSCAAAAATRVKTHRKNPCGSAKPQHPIQEIGTDVAGPFPPDRHGNKYYCVFQCRFTKYRAIFPMKAKNENILPHFLSFVESAKRSNPDTSIDDVAAVRVDGGGEFVEFKTSARILESKC